MRVAPLGLCRIFIFCPTRYRVGSVGYAPAGLGHRQSIRFSSVQIKSN